MRRFIYCGMLVLSVGVFVSCENGSDASIAGSGGNAPTGQGGSLARFALGGDYLYCVDQFALKVLNVSNPSEVFTESVIDLGWEIETIFPKDTLLFIGSATGMMIYDISQPTNPQFVSEVEHIFSCDPVVADDNYAYVTLSTGARRCSRGLNELQIIDISDLYDPRLVETYDMSNPQGLGIDNGTLFVCDNGLKVYNASDVHDIKLAHHFPIPAFDVIPTNGVLMVIASDGVYQYTYDGEGVEQISKIAYTGN